MAHLLGARLDDALAAVTPASPYLGAEAAQAAAEAWRAAARPGAQFPAEAWAEAVRDAARLALAHLVHPAETLSEAAVQDAPVAAATALARMRAFGPYPYFPEIVARYVERKGLDALDRDGLERLLRRIHRRMVAQFGPDEWLLLLEPLFGLAAPVGRPMGTVPPALLRPLLAVDGPGPADALGDAPVRLDDLRARLDGAAPEAPFRFDAVPAAATPPPSAPRIATRPPALRPPPMPPIAEGVRPPVIGSRFQSPEEALDDDSAVLGPPRPAASDPVANGPVSRISAPLPAAQAAPDDDEPLWKRLARERAEPDPTEASPAEAAPPPDPDEQPLWRRFAADAEETTESATDARPDPPVEEDAFVAEAAEIAADDPEPGTTEGDALEARVLGAGARDQRDWYVKNLFDGDETAYLRTLGRLGEAPSYTAATSVISDDVFRAYRVSPYTDAAVAFTDAVQAQFGGR